MHAFCETCKEILVNQSCGVFPRHDKPQTHSVQMRDLDPGSRRGGSEREVDCLQIGSCPLHVGRNGVNRGSVTVTTQRSKKTTELRIVGAGRARALMSVARAPVRKGSDEEGGSELSMLEFDSGPWDVGQVRFLELQLLRL